MDIALVFFNPFKKNRDATLEAGRTYLETTFSAALSKFQKASKAWDMVCTKSKKSDLTHLKGDFHNILSRHPCDEQYYLAGCKPSTEQKDMKEEEFKIPWSSKLIRYQVFEARMKKNKSRYVEYNSYV